MGESLDLPGFPTIASLQKTMGELSCREMGVGKGGCTVVFHAGLHIFRQIILSCWNVVHAHTDCFLSLILS